MNTRRIIYVDIDTPRQVDSAKTRQEVEKLIQTGHKTNEILLHMNFFVPPNVANSIVGKFQVIKNKAAFARDKNTNQ
jgi:hypothetical protein